RFFAEDLRDPATRTKAAQLGRRYLGLDGKPQPKAVPPDLRGLVIAMAVQEGDQATFDAVYARFGQTTDPDERNQLRWGLVSVTDERSQRALGLALDPALRV